MDNSATDGQQAGSPLGLGLSEGLGPNEQAAPWQAGMTNAQLAEAWGKKLPGVAPTNQDLTAFALGAEVGFDHARKLERQDWSRVHHALAKHKAHPGRTDDHLADVIDRQLAALHECMADMLDVLRMVDDNHRVDEGENRKAWSGRFVVQEVRRVLALGPNS